MILFVPFNHNLGLIKVPMVHVSLVESTIDSTIIKFVVLRVKIAFLSFIYNFNMKTVFFIKFLIGGSILSQDS